MQVLYDRVKNYGFLSKTNLVEVLSADGWVCALGEELTLAASNLSLMALLLLDVQKSQVHQCHIAFTTFSVSFCCILTASCSFILNNITYN